MYKNDFFSQLYSLPLRWYKTNSYERMNTKNLSCRIFLRKLSARRCLVRACVEIAIEIVALAAVVESRVSGHTQEVSLAVVGLLIESIFGETEAFAVGVYWTFEAQIAGSIAVSNYIRPVAVICLGVEGQTLRTLEQVAATIDAVQELIALVRRVAHSEVSKLVRAVIGRLCRLKYKNVTTAINWTCLSIDYLEIWSPRAVNVDRILARIGEQTRFLVEPQSVRALFLLANAILFD